VSFWHTFGLEGSYFEPTHYGIEAAVEFTCGLAAGLATHEGETRNPASAQDLLRLLDESFEVAKLLVLAESQGGSPIEDELRYRSRLQTLLVRGEAYVDHGEQLARSLFEPETKWMQRELGFSVVDMIALENGLTSLLERRVREVLTTVAEESAELDTVLGNRNAPGALRKAMTKFGKRGVKERFFIEKLADGLADAMPFSVDDILDETSDLRRGSAERILSAFRISDDANYWSPLQRSPLVTGPFFPLDDRFLVPVMGLLRRDLTQLLESLVLQHRPRFPARRAKVLDNLAISFLEEALPGSKTYTSVYYPIGEDDSAEMAECDGLLLWNDVCLVLEGKGKPLSPQSRRGDVKRLQADLEASLAEAWNQGNRVINYMHRVRPAVFHDDKGKELLAIDGGGISYTKVITPTIHTLADHALHLEQFVDMGLKVQGDPPWAVPINDLRIVCDLVRSPAELLCYMRWRDQLHLGRISVAADEADVFGAFLLRQPYPSMAAGEGILHIGSHSTDFDTYYMRRRTGSRADKPGMFSVPLVDGFVDRLVEEHPGGWLDAADVVLTLSLQQLAFLDYAAPLLARVAEETKRIESRSQFGATVVGLPPSDEASLPEEGESTGPHIFVVIDREATNIIWARSSN